MDQHNPQGPYANLLGASTQYPTPQPQQPIQSQFNNGQPSMNQPQPDFLPAQPQQQQPQQYPQQHQQVITVNITPTSPLQDPVTYPPYSQINPNNVYPFNQLHGVQSPNLNNPADPHFLISRGRDSRFNLTIAAACSSVISFVMFLGFLTWQAHGGFYLFPTACSLASCAFSSALTLWGLRFAMDPATHSRIIITYPTKGPILIPPQPVAGYVPTPPQAPGQEQTAIASRHRGRIALPYESNDKMRNQWYSLMEINQLMSALYIIAIFTLTWFFGSVDIFNFWFIYMSILAAPAAVIYFSNQAMKMEMASREEWAKWSTTPHPDGSLPSIAQPQQPTSSSSEPRPQQQQYPNGNGGYGGYQNGPNNNDFQQYQQQQQPPQYQQQYPQQQEYNPYQQPHQQPQYQQQYGGYQQMA